MALHVTSFGRVGIDVERLPRLTALPNTERRAPAFAELLDEPEAPTPTVTPQPAETPTPRSPTPEHHAPPEAPPRPRPGARTAEPGASQPAPADPATRAEPPAPRTPATRLESRTAPPASPEAHRPPQSAPPDPTSPPPATPGSTPSPSVPIAAPPPPPAPRTVTVAGSAARTAPAPTRPTTPRAGPAYRTLTSHLVHQLEEARESVVRRLTLLATEDGGRARVLLDPPELGRVDLDVVLEETRLSVAASAERTEVAAWLANSWTDLEHALEGQGLTLTAADVRTGDRDTGADRERDAAPGAPAGEDTGAVRSTRPAAIVGRHDGSGLDTWV